MRKPGIEPGAQRWQRWILPLNHLRCSTILLTCSYIVITNKWFSFLIEECSICTAKSLNAWRFVPLL